MELFTIGHSNHPLETAISLLQKHGITAVADVRSHPYSRFLPHFNREALKEALRREGITYVFLGKELGARPSNPECYVDGKAVYERIAETHEFDGGIERVLKGGENYRISLMCAEQDPLNCHRAILVCQYLRKRNPSLEIQHILKDGSLETHSHLEERMLAKHGFREFEGVRDRPTQLSLFAQPTREECLEKAYKLQGEEIAYIEEKDD